MALQLSQAPSTRGTPQELHTATAATPVPFFCISLDLTRHDFMCLRNCDLPNASSRTPQSQVLQSATFMAYVRTGGLVAAGHSVHLPLSRMVRHLGQRGYPGAFATCGLGMWLELDDPDATSSPVVTSGKHFWQRPMPTWEVWHFRQCDQVWPDCSPGGRFALAAASASFLARCWASWRQSRGIARLVVAGISTHKPCWRQSPATTNLTIPLQCLAPWACSLAQRFALCAGPSKVAVQTTKERRSLVETESRQSPLDGIPEQSCKWRRTP